MLLALTALASTSIAASTELAFACAGRKGWLVRPGPAGLAARRAYRALDRGIPFLSGVAAASSLGLALSAGLASRAGCIGLGATLALAAHMALYAQVGRPFHAEGKCLELARIPPHELARLKDRWEIAMTTRASLLAAAFVCVVACVVLP